MTTIRFKRKGVPGFRQRILRTYSRVAERSYDCDWCLRDIMPGEMYDGEVNVITYDSIEVARMYLPKLNRKSIVFVRRYHADGCDFDPWDDEFEEDRAERCGEEESHDLADAA